MKQRMERYMAFGHNEREWIDQWYDSLILTLRCLDLIKHHPLPTGIKWNRQRLYDRLTSYRK